MTVPIVYSPTIPIPKRSKTPIPEVRESLRRPSERRVSFPQIQEVFNSRSSEIVDMKKGIDKKFNAIRKNLAEMQDTTVIKFLEMSDTLTELNADLIVLRQACMQLDEKINRLMTELDIEMNLTGSRSLHRRVKSSDF